MTFGADIIPSRSTAINQRFLFLRQSDPFSVSIDEERQENNDSVSLKRNLQLRCVDTWLVRFNCRERRERDEVLN
jgi:hypothetical protein